MSWLSAIHRSHASLKVKVIEYVVEAGNVDLRKGTFGKGGSSKFNVFREIEASYFGMIFVKCLIPQSILGIIFTFIIILLHDTIYAILFLCGALRPVRYFVQPQAEQLRPHKRSMVVDDLSQIFQLSCLLRQAWFVLPRASSCVFHELLLDRTNLGAQHISPL